MGTNYTIHIGKRSGLPEGSEPACQFEWAIPAGIIALLSANARVIEDEYGRQLSVGEFLALALHDDWVTDNIGERFS